MLSMPGKFWTLRTQSLYTQLLQFRIHSQHLLCSKLWSRSDLITLIFNIPAVTHVSVSVQYSSSEHGVVERHVIVDWQVRGRPAVSSLQDARPVTIEQSDVTAQITEYLAWIDNIIKFKLTIMTYIWSIAIFTGRTNLGARCWRLTGFSPTIDCFFTYICPNNDFTVSIWIAVN